MRTCYICIYIECTPTVDGKDTKDKCLNPGGEGYEKDDFDPYEDDANCDQFWCDEDPELNYGDHDCDKSIEINSDYSACSQCGAISHNLIG